MNTSYSSNCTIIRLGQQCIVESTVTGLKDFASLFYIIDIKGSIKDRVEDVPNYEILLFPVIGMLIYLEQVIRVFQKKALTRFEDVVVNMGSSLLFTLCRVFLYVFVIRVFDFVYTNYRVVDLPLHSVSTWIISLLLVEFVYYWTHRALHEFNILWAAHQFHHQAEDVNITTTIRDSVVDLVIYDFFPIPLALIIPPPILALHIQFSLIYQIWLHNEVVGSLGPLEYIINTPRQHRVHHGKNPYCIDKNYGALLMIWDRIFGTYQTEKQKIIFGCVAPVPKHFDPLGLQFGYYAQVIKKFSAMETFGDKLSALFKGPGWAPGKPRLGLISDVPEPDPEAPKYGYQPYIATWKKVYVYLHGFTIVMGFYMMADHPLIKYSPLKGLACMLYVLLALTSFSAIFDNRWFLELLEIFRCFVYFAFDYYLLASVPWPIEGPTMRTIFSCTLWAIRIFHALSVIFWAWHYFFRFSLSSEGILSKKQKLVFTTENLGISINDKVAKSETGTDEKNNNSSSIMFFNLKATTLLLLLTLGFFSSSYTTFLYVSKTDACAKLIEEVVEEVQKGLNHF